VRTLFEARIRRQQGVFIVSGSERAIFDRADMGLHVDIFYNSTSATSFAGTARLEVDKPSIPLAELLLEKMQIVQINEKDVIDTIMLLLEHELGDIDKETINIGRVAQLCANDWGLWRTTTLNLEKVRSLAHGYEQLTAEEKAHVQAKTEAALKRIEAEPKPMAWRLRDRVGDRVKWYKDVDEVH
jgi:hypothetical protein